MATVIKSRARKLSAVGKPGVSYANYATPGLLENKHVVVRIDELIIRLTFDEARRLVKDINHYVENPEYNK